MTERPASLSHVEQRPSCSEESVIRMLRREYGIDGRLERLPSERDQNFRVRVDGEPRYVAKISNTAERRDVVDLQHRAMEHLASRGIGCPVAVPSGSGGTIITHEGHLACVITHVPGDLMATRTTRSPRLAHGFGVFLGRVTQALSDFAHPAARRELQWDVLNTADVIERYLPDVEAHRRPLVERARDANHEIVHEASQVLPHSVIHNDANDHNVMIDDESVTGLIDFGDMVHSLTLNELAVGCAYAVLGQADPVAMIDTVVSGYASVVPLTPDERTLVPELVRSRLATSVAISAHQHALAPDDPYLTVSEDHAWQTLAVMDRHLEDFYANQD